MLDRRAVVVVVTAALSGAAAVRAETPAPPAGGSTIVIVHGAWGGSWAFRQVEALLTARGHKVHPGVSGFDRALFGRGQVIRRERDGRLVGGCDPRSDGCARSTDG